MKILNKIKKVFVGIGIFFITIYTKVLAASNSLETQLMYGVPSDQNAPINIRENLLRMLGLLLIPLITIIIGAIIYWRKSKSSNKIKIVTLALIIVVLIIFLMIYIKLKNNL